MTFVPIMLKEYTLLEINQKTPTQFHQIQYNKTFISGKPLFHLYHNYDARATFHNNAGKENLIKGNF